LPELIPKSSLELSPNIEFKRAACGCVDVPCAVSQGGPNTTSNAERLSLSRDKFIRAKPASIKREFMPRPPLPSKTLAFRFALAKAVEREATADVQVSSLQSAR
jgi:hypothetical protein